MDNEIIESEERLKDIDNEKVKYLEEYIKKETEADIIFSKIQQKRKEKYQKEQDEWEKESFMSIMEEKERERLRKERKMEIQEKIKEIKELKNKKINQKKKLKEFIYKMSEMVKWSDYLLGRREDTIAEEIEELQEMENGLYKRIAEIYEK